MSNLNGIPSADYFETTLANTWNGTTGTVYVDEVPSASMPVGEYSYIVVNPGESNMQVAKIDGWDIGNKTFNVIDVVVDSGAGTQYTAKTHPLGAIVRFSNNYAFWKDIQTAVNTKADDSDISTVGKSNDYNDLDNIPTFALVATTGDYDDLSNTPTPITIDGADKILQLSGSNVLSATVTASYDSGTKKITLYGANSAVISEIDCTAFIKDGMIQNVQIVTDPAGYAPGKYLEFDFNTDSGVSDIYIALSDLAVYTAGEGISISSNAISVVAATASTLGGIKVGSGLSINSGTLSADSQTDENYTTAEKTKLAGIETGAEVNDIEKVQVNGTDLPISSKTVNVKIKTLNGEQIAGEGDLDIMARHYTEGTGICISCSDEISISSAYQTIISCKANCSDIPTDNCQLGNSCGYTTCTGTLVADDIANLAQCCDIPTDNCQLGNGCGYITSSALCGYALSCDIPTDNCQLANGCGYTTLGKTTTNGDCGALYNGQNVDAVIDRIGISTSTNLLGDTCNVAIRSNGSNPFIGLQVCGGTKYYLQAKSDGMYFGPTSTNAMKFDSTGNATFQQGSVTAKNGFIKCGGTSSQFLKADGSVDSSSYALSCDIPTDNCQLSNGCGYITGIDSGDVTTALGYTPADSASLGTASTKDTGICCGDVPILGAGGKLANSVIPAVAISDTFTVTDKSDLTGLTSAEKGDVGIVTSESKSYILSADPYSTAANWKELLTPTDAVTSVNGQTGAVCLSIPTDNCELSNGCGYTTCTGTVTSSDLACYAQCCDMVCSLTGADNSHYPSAKAVADALSCAGAGDMLASTYDPCNCSTDAFNYNNMYNKPTIPTDNCQLANSCGYTTCTGTLSTCSDITTALGYTPYSAANPCGYTTCTGTLSSCSDVITALGFTPYSCANPAGYTTCTGTLTASDLTGYAKSCDLATVATSGKYCDLTGRVTDNCQLANGCGFTTCTGTLSSCSDVISALGYTPYNSSNPNGYTSCTGTLNGGDLKTVNSNCLVGSGNISITEFNPASSGSTGQVLTKTVGGYDRSTKQITTTVTLSSASWSSHTQTVSVIGVTASNTVIVSPDPSSMDDYTNAAIYCSAQGNGTLTFTATTDPTNNITVNVVILN